MTECFQSIPGVYSPEERIVYLTTAWTRCTYQDRNCSNVTKVAHDVNESDCRNTDLEMWPLNLLEQNVAELSEQVQGQMKCLQHLQDVKTRNDRFYEQTKHMYLQDLIDNTHRQDVGQNLSGEIEDFKQQIKDLTEKNKISQLKFIASENRRDETKRKLKSFKNELDRKTRQLCECGGMDKDTIEAYAVAKAALENEKIIGKVFEKKLMWYQWQLDQMSIPYD